MEKYIHKYKTILSLRSYNSDTNKYEDKLIKGLGAVPCGLMMINHKGINEKIVDVLIDAGFSRDDYINNLTKTEE